MEQQNEPSETPCPEANTRNDRVVSEVYEWVEWGAGIIIFVVLLLTFVIRTVTVFGPSMEPTLHERNGLLTTRLGGAPKNGQIVAIVQPNAINEPLIKRVIATGGQTVDIDFDTGEVSVDGTVLEEPYINDYTYLSYDMTFPQTVPEGCVFVMGDNRNHSLDSRSSIVGMIDNRYILGKILFRFAPLDRIGVP